METELYDEMIHKCPYCGSESEQEPCRMPWTDYDDVNAECSICGNKFRVVCRVTKVCWKSVGDDQKERAEEDECEHEFIEENSGQSEYEPSLVYFRGVCKKCGEVVLGMREKE